MNARMISGALHLLPDESLDKIGIPRRFRKVSPGSHPCATLMNDWLRREGVPSLMHDGASWIFDIRCNEGLSMLPLLALGAHRNGVGVRILRLDEIAGHITHRREDEIKRLFEFRLLIVQDFFDVYRTYKAPPFTPNQLRGVEDLLIKRQLAERPSVLEVYNPNGLPIRNLTWWRQSSFVRLAPNFLAVSSRDVRSYS